MESSNTLLVWSASSYLDFSHSRSMNTRFPTTVLADHRSVTDMTNIGFMTTYLRKRKAWVQHMKNGHKECGKVMTRMQHKLGSDSSVYRRINVVKNLTVFEDVLCLDHLQDIVWKQDTEPIKRNVTGGTYSFWWTPILTTWYGNVLLPTPHSSQSHSAAFEYRQGNMSSQECQAAVSWAEKGWRKRSIK